MRQTFNKSRGLSLVEMLVTMLLLGIMLALSFGFSRSSKAGSDTRAGAMQVADLLRSLRQRALSTGHPVAAALPSNNGALSVTTSLQVLQGETNPKLLNVTRYTANTGNIQLFLGTYAGPTWSSTRPQGILGQGPNFATWNQHGPSDPVLYFAPDGTVFSNVPHDQGNYRLIVAQDIQASAGTLTGVFKPVTISVSLLGAIQVESGLVNGSSGLVQNQPVGGSGLAGPANPSTGNQNPSFVAPHVSIFPRAEASTLTNVSLPGSNYTVPLDGYMTLECFATDPDGDPLFCRWTASGPSGGGSFSSPQGNRMAWDATRQCWVGRWTWRPPSNATVDQQYTINCEVYDGQGGVANGVPILAMMPKTTTILRRKIVHSATDGTGNDYLYVCNWDGTNDHKILACNDISPTAGDLTFPKWSPSNRSIAFAVSDGGSHYIMLCNPNGQELRTVGTNAGGPTRGLEWSPDGSYIYTLHHFGGNVIIRRWNAGEVGQTSPDPIGSWPDGGATWISFLAMHPSGLFLGLSVGTESWVVWTDQSTQPGKLERHPVNTYGEPFFDEYSGTPRWVYDTGGASSELAWRAFTYDEPSCTSTLSPIENKFLPPGTTGYQSPMISTDGRWMVGQYRSGPNLLCFLMEMTRLEPMHMNLALPDTDDASFSW